MAGGAFDLAELRAQVEVLDGRTWQVERTLRSTPFAETQVVRRAGTGEGPFIRKLFYGSGQGAAYETLFRAQREGASLAHVPAIYDCTRTADGIAVVMERVDGCNLREYVAKVGPGDAAARFAAPALCEALGELHAALGAPIIHRDVKPGNIMVTPAGVVLIDFDITRTWQEGVDRDTMRFGTPGYAPPEQYGFGQTGVAGDIFAAGMTLAFCCTGEDPTSQLRESGFDDARIPAWIRPVLVRATAFDPAGRYQSANQMLADVRAAMAGEPLPSASGERHGRSAGMRLPAPGRVGGSALARIFKYLWNAFWVSVFIVVFITLGEEANLLFTDGWAEAMLVAQDHPARVAVAVVFTLSLFPTAGLLLYLMLFKIHRDKLGPLAKLSWKQELPVGGGIVAFVLLVVFYVSDYIYAVL